jgi:hypothetical protein
VQVRKEDQGTRVWKIRIWRDKTRRCTTNTTDDSNLVVGMLRRLGIQGGSLVRVEGTCNLVPATCKTFLFCYHACNYTTTMAKKHMHAPTTPFRSTVVTRHRTIIRVVNAIDSALRKEKDWKPSRSRNAGMCVVRVRVSLFPNINQTYMYIPSSHVSCHAAARDEVTMASTQLSRERSSIMRKQQASQA